MQEFLYFITFLCIGFGIYKIVIDDQKGLASVSFIFGVLTFLIAILPTETTTTTGETQFPTNTEIETESEFEIEETEDDGKIDSTEVSIPENTTTVNTGNAFSENNSNLVKIEGTQFSGNISKEDECHTYEYIPSVSGVYRFDFSSDNTQSDYKFKMYASDKSKKADVYYSNDGVTVELVQGEQYKIYVKQYSGFSNYTVNIGIPNLTQEISDISFSGNIAYTDQTDRYTYTAPVTGVYRFDFSSDNTQSDYMFKMYASDKSKKADVYYSNKGISVNLVEGEIYTIKVIQYSGTGNYTINIGVPNAPIEITENFILGNITYINQENSYIYKAQASGKYIFNFESNDVNTDYKVYVISSTNEKKMSIYYSYKSGEVQLEEGQVYTIKVVQYRGMPTYKINISISTE